jgi:hypothetical protein
LGIENQFFFLFSNTQQLPKKKFKNKKLILFLERPRGRERASKRGGREGGRERETSYVCGWGPHPLGRVTTSSPQGHLSASARTQSRVRADATCFRVDASGPRGRVNASAWTHFLPSARTVKTYPRVKTHPRGKCGRERTFRR